MRYIFSLAVAIPLLLFLTPTVNAWPYWGGGDPGYGANYGDQQGYGPGGGVPGPIGGPGYAGDDRYTSGWNHGVADATYDHTNNLVYNPSPACGYCHTPTYMDGFRHGYDQQWNTYTSQESTQTINNYINIANSPGAYVNLNDRQNSAQSADTGYGSGGYGGYPDP